MQLNIDLHCQSLVVSDHVKVSTGHHDTLVTGKKNGNRSPHSKSGGDNLSGLRNHVSKAAVTDVDRSPRLMQTARTIKEVDIVFENQLVLAIHYDDCLAVLLILL